MAKRKKQTRQKKAAAAERSSFWPLSGAILLFILALFLLLGGFGSGGPLPKTLFHGAYWALGWAAYLSPVALTYWGIYKFMSEDKQIPLDRLVSMGVFVLLASAWTYVGFASPELGGSYSGGFGGSIGTAIGNVILAVVDKFPAAVLLFVLTVLAFFLTFGISPKVFLKLAGLFKREGDSDLATLKQQAAEGGFKLNEGVPVEHHASPRLSGVPKPAQKLADDQEALTVASDPAWQFPPLTLLNHKQDKADAGDIEGNARLIKESFNNFNFDVAMEGANIGPRVTQYTLKPPAGVKLTKLTALENNLSLDLAAHSIRMEAPIPGTRLVGIEVPNVKPAMVRISALLESTDWQGLNSPLGFGIGKDIAGSPIVGDLARMPHLLIAGQTGSGKSIMINTILTSLLYRNSPSDLKLILVDPKRVELKPYDGIPHLLTPVITEPEKCISALKWTVAEMERRYRALSEANRRNIVEYNNLKTDEGMPYIVIVIDELADLMMMAARDVESLVVRIAQKARAVGIHLVLATQRPSVDVITGLIKANVPARIAFTTNSQVDSRTIIDQIGAEKLLGQGDMLFMTAEMSKPKRVQGALIDIDEVQKVADFLRLQRPPQYDDEIVSQPVQLTGRGGIVADYGANEFDDTLWKDAVQVVIEGRKASTSLLQRRLRVGYARAARLIEAMEEQGIVGPADGSRPREVLVSNAAEVFAAKDDDAEGDVYDEIPDEEKA